MAMIRGANVVSTLTDMGFDVISGPLFRRPEKLADWLLAEKCDAVVPSIWQRATKTLIPETDQSC